MEAVLCHFMLTPEKGVMVVPELPGVFSFFISYQ